MQCPDCDAKDLVTIAGKTFCANCGTPAPNTTSSPGSTEVNTDTANSVVQPNTATSQDVVTPASVVPNTPTAPAEPTQPVAADPSPSAQPSGISRFQARSPQLGSTDIPDISVPAQPQPPAPIQSTSPTPVVPATAPVDFVPAPAGPPPPDESTADHARQAIANIQMTSTPQPVVDTAISTPSNEQPVPVSPPSPVVSSAPVVASAPNTSLPPSSPTPQVDKDENIGSELSSLDSHDEGVFSDEQLSELSSATPDVAVSRPGSYAPVKPMQDILPGGSTQMVIHPPAAPNTNVFTAPVMPPSQNTSSNSMDSMSRASSSAAPVAGSVIKPTNTNTDGIDASAALAATSAASEASTLIAQTQPTAPASQPQQPSSPAPKKNKKVASKIASVSLSMAGILLLGVYVWQINYPNLALKVAGSKAGISASLPSYMPSGWKVAGDIQANPGSIAYNLQSEDGSKKIAVSEDRTDWDSQALAENYLQSKANNYTALQAQGLTIYLYNNQASWVNHGTWYRIEGDNHGLSQDQIIKMATSL